MHGEGSLILGTPACQVLGIIDDQWPLSALTQNAPPPQSVKSLTAVEIPSPSNIVIHHKNQFETNSPESAPPSDDDLLSNLNCITTTRVSSLNAERKKFTYSEDTNFSPILEAYEDVFNDATLPEMKGDTFKINLKPDTQPYAQLKARRIPIPYLQQLKKQLEEMEHLGIISTHEEPSPWCHPIVIAPKKQSDELRMCIVH